MQGAMHALSFARGDDGRMHAETLAFAAGTPAASSWGGAACDAAVTALSDAAAAESAARGERVTLAGGAVYAVLDEALINDGVCFIRRVSTDPDAGAPPLPAPAAALGGFTGELPPPCALLLLHAFHIAPEGAPAGDGGATSTSAEAPAAQRLTLTTLLARPASDEALLRAALCGDAEVALSADGVSTWLTLDGDAVSADALAALSSQLRAAVRTAQRLQLLAAAAAAVAARAGTPFASLVPPLLRLRPALSEPLHALHAQVAGAYAARGAAGGVTRELLDARTHQAEGLEAAGRFLDAAVLYRRNIEDDARAPGAHLLASPPMEWAYLGLALKRAGRLGDAAAAYAAGLAAAADGPVEPDTPTWRESLRLHLRNLEVTLRLAQRDLAAANAAVLELFRNELAAPRAPGATVEPMWDFRALGGSGFLRERPSGRGWGLTASIELAAMLGPPQQVFRTRELTPDAVGRCNLARLEEMGVRCDLNVAAAAAAAELKASMSFQAGRERALPRMPPPRCARCGAAADKRCAACNGAAYCGAACQHAHWPAHKAACKAARKAAGAAQQAA